MCRTECSPRRLVAHAVGPNAAVGFLGVDALRLYEPATQEEPDRHLALLPLHMSASADGGRGRARVALDGSRDELQQVAHACALLFGHRHHASPRSPQREQSPTGGIRSRARTWRPMGPWRGMSYPP